MSSLVRVKRGYSHQPVNPCLRLEITEGESPLGENGGALYAGFIPVLGLKQFRRKALPLRVPEVHAKKHLGPVLGFRPPRPCVYRYDGVSGIVGTAENPGELEFGKPGFHGREHAARLFNRILIVLADRKFEKTRRVLHVGAELLESGDAVLDFGLLLKRFAR